MKNLLRALAFLVGSFVAGELIKRLLTSRPGGAVMQRLGRPELATHEGAHAASKEVKRGIGFVRNLLQAPNAPPEAPKAVAGPRWVGIARDSAEMLLAAGAVLKTMADFVQEDEKLRQRIGRGAASK